MPFDEIAGVLREDIYGKVSGLCFMRGLSSLHVFTKDSGYDQSWSIMVKYVF